MSNPEETKEDKWNVSLYSIKRDISNNTFITLAMSYLSLVLAETFSYYFAEGAKLRELILVFLLQLIPTVASPAGTDRSSPFLFFVFLILFLFTTVAIVVFISRKY